MAERRTWVQRIAAPVWRFTGWVYGTNPQKPKPPVMRHLLQHGQAMEDVGTACVRVARALNVSVIDVAEALKTMAAVPRNRDELVRETGTLRKSYVEVTAMDGQTNEYVTTSEPVHLSIPTGELVDDWTRAMHPSPLNEWSTSG